MVPQLTVTAVIVFAMMTTARAQDGAAVPLDRLMSPAIQKATGIHKLSPPERERLRDYLLALMRISYEDGRRGAMREVAAKAGVEKNTRPQDVPLRTRPETDTLPTPGASPAIIESRIDGEFTGWTGETVFKLQNGQIWQQASFAYMYRYAYSPEILIYRSSTGYKMKVDGVDQEIHVQRVK